MPMLFPIPPQTQAPVPPAAPPATPATGLPTPTVVLPGIPQNARDLMQLRVRGGELANQLNSARSRRDQLAQRISRGDPDVQGLQQQITYLDGRILNLEKAIDENGQLIANAAPGVLVQMPGRFPFQDFTRQRMDPTPIFIVFILFVLAPVAFGFVWRSLRRGSTATLPPGWNDHIQRMDRLEQAVDTIAIEIERISEGQRFLTRTLADRGSIPNGGVPQRAPEPIPVATPGEATSPKALGAGAMEPLQVGEREAVAEKR